MVPTIEQTVQISDNYLNDSHLLPERPQIDSQSATECRHAIHHTQIIWALILCRNGHDRHLAVAVSFLTPPADHHPPTAKNQDILYLGSWHFVS